MFERRRRDRFAILAAAADAAEGHDRADIVSVFGQLRDLVADVEIGLLNADGRGGGHGRGQPPVIGGKNAISRAPDITASGFTCVWSIAARITFGFSNA